jgi:hypothetical protein
LTAKRKSGGHPAKQDPVMATLDKSMKSAVELTRDLQGRLTEDTWLHVRSAALGLMWAWSELTGQTNPADVVDEEYKTMEQIKADAWEAGFTACAQEHMHQQKDPTHPITRINPHPGGDS